jgi:transmembrane sensor
MSRLNAIQDRAASWILAREEPGWTDQSQAELDAWLAESDLHRVTFLRLEKGWRDADRMRSLGPLAEPPQSDKPAVIARPSWRRRWMPLAAAASIAAAFGIASGQYGKMVGSEASEVVSTRFATPVGGHQLIGLSDGTKVELNTASVVRAAVGQIRREVWLDRGEAYFEVEHDERRPFVVHAGSRQVTVLGTKFSVRREGDEVTVYVREGRVRVDDLKGARSVRSTTITGGDIALAKGTATLVTAQSDERVQDALAWREGMLSFDQKRLSDVAAEFNRYNRQQLVLTDSDAANIRIGGMFPSSKPDDFAHLLRDAYGLEVDEGPEVIRISS